MNSQITIRLTISGIVAIVIIAGALWLAADTSTGQIVTFYEDKLRGALFAGFLSLAGFLFSLKTFIVIKMKENVYDHEYYRARVRERQKLNSAITRYGPLRNLANLLFISVILSFLSAVSQFSIGVIGSIYGDIFCMWISVFTIFMLIISLIEMNSNLRVWFDDLDREENRNNNF